VENYLFKILLGGCVGHKRTEIISRFTTGQFHSTSRIIIGVDFAAHCLELPDKEGTVTLQIWDFDQEKRFRSLVPCFCQGAAGAMLFFDLYQSDTLFELSEWISIIRKHTNRIPIILCGTISYDTSINSNPSHKLDEKEIQNFLIKHHLNEYLELNVETGCNVNESFEILSTLMVQQWSLLNFGTTDRITALLQPQLL